VIKITAKIYRGRTASQIGHKVLDLIGRQSSKGAKNPLLNSIRD
jgi:hypothetical protein